MLQKHVEHMLYKLCHINLIQGVTAICLLSESHISIHTWPEKGEAAVDVFTCGDAEPKIACDIIIEQLHAKHYDLEFIQR